MALGTNRCALRIKLSAPSVLASHPAFRSTHPDHVAAINQNFRFDFRRVLASSRNRRPNNARNEERAFLERPPWRSTRQPSLTGAIRSTPAFGSPAIQDRSVRTSECPRILRGQRQPCCWIDRLTNSSRRACAGATRSFIEARTAGGAVSGEPELNGGAGLYSIRS